MEDDSKKLSDLEARVKLLEKKLELCFQLLDDQKRPRRQQIDRYQAIGEMSLEDFSDEGDTPS